MPDCTVARLRKSELEEIVIGIREYQSHEFVDIRVFFGVRGQETKPTKKGVTIPLELYREFHRSMEELHRAMKERGWA